MLGNPGGGVLVFTFPWPGPGNSEGPNDPEAPPDASRTEEEGAISSFSEADLLATAPWPGPGNSEG